MVDINALNMVLWAVAVATAVAICTAAAAITLAWLAGRRRQLRHAASGIRRRGTPGPGIQEPRRPLVTAP